MEPLLRFVLPVRGVVRHAAQQHVHGEDDAQQHDGVKDAKCSKMAKRRGRQFRFFPMRNVGSITAVKQREETHPELDHISQAHRCRISESRSSLVGKVRVAMLIFRIFACCVVRVGEWDA